jgi:hypothetical protein
MRIESRRVDPSSIVIAGQLAASKRDSLLNRIAVSSLKKERAANRSLALLRPEIISFRAVRRAPEELAKQRATYAAIEAQSGLFEAIGRVIPRDRALIISSIAIATTTAPTMAPARTGKPRRPSFAD